jgi:hypothetical protein
VANLYAIGWRQGSFVEAELPMAGLVLDDHGQVRAWGKRKKMKKGKM